VRKLQGHGFFGGDRQWQDRYLTASVQDKCVRYYDVKDASARPRDTIAFADIASIDAVAGTTFFNINVISGRSYEFDGAADTPMWVGFLRSAVAVLQPVNPHARMLLDIVTSAPFLCVQTFFVKHVWLRLGLLACVIN